MWPLRAGVVVLPLPLPLVWCWWVGLGCRNAERRGVGAGAGEPCSICSISPCTIFNSRVALDRISWSLCERHIHRPEVRSSTTWATHNHPARTRGHVLPHLAAWLRCVQTQPSRLLSTPTARPVPHPRLAPGVTTILPQASSQRLWMHGYSHRHTQPHTATHTHTHTHTHTMWAPLLEHTTTRGQAAVVPVPSSLGLAGAAAAASVNAARFAGVAASRLPL